MDNWVKTVKLVHIIPKCIYLNEKVVANYSYLEELLSLSKAHTVKLTFLESVSIALMVFRNDFIESLHVIGLRFILGSHLFCLLPIAASTSIC